MRYFTSLLVLVFLSIAANAQEKTSTILVLDGSGSMWGQIDGKAKITIAQEVIGKLLTDLPDQQQLGLTVYGHRRKGDCTDIETIVMPGSETRSAIGAAVNAIKPKGKTPMTEAVIAAAKALRYIEERATVILVSDGIETCHPDPCAAAIALEEAGVDFTAHVVGFNIDDPEAIAQMQCLANETGGTFRSAENATELAEALIVVAAPPAPEPEPEPVTINFKATLGKGGPVISSGLVWSFVPDGTGAQTDPTGDTSLDMLPGEYSVSVLRLKDEISADTAFFVEKLSKTVTVILPELVYKATLDAVASAPIGSSVDVTWDAEIGNNDYVAIALPEMRENNYAGYSYISKGNPLSVTMPLIPGDYEFRYIRSADGRNEVLTTRSILLTDIEVTLEAAAETGVGNVLDVIWDGPNYQGDYITIVPTDAKDTVYKNYAYTRKGNPAEVTAPIEPGKFEVRYVAKGNPDRVLARRALDVVAVSSSLEAAIEVAAGSPVEVTWEGPDNKNDYISISVTDAKAGSYEAYAYTRNGNPAVVKMPLESGEYQLRYIANGNPDKILAMRAISVVEVQATLEAEVEAVAGSILEVTWEGPDNKNDYISVATLDHDTGKYINYAYTRRGTPAEVKMPLDPGNYELRYIASGSPDKILGRRPVTIAAADVSLNAVVDAIAGSMIEVTWDGPDNKNDYISVADIGTKAQKYHNYKYTKSGTPALVVMPLEPGDYQLRYIASGSPDQILATRTISVAAAEVVLDAPKQGVVGTSVDVSYIGPDNGNDYIAIAEIGSKPNKYSNYQYTRRGNPVLLDLPTMPGTYLIRYVAAGNPAKVLARKSIKVVETSVVVEAAILEAAESANTKSEVEVFWVGPDAEGDRIIVSKVGSGEAEAEVTTASGNPAILLMPKTAGAYILRYISGDGSTIGSRPIKLN